MFGRDFLVHLDRAVQGPGERGFSTTGTSCSRATSRIFRAIRSTPLATQTGAFMPRSYSRDGEMRRIGDNTEALGTAAIMRFRMRVCRNWATFP